jgi:hypothetical protein
MEESDADLRFDPLTMVHTWCYVDATPCPLCVCISDELVRYGSETSSGLLVPLQVQETVVTAYHYQ